MSFLGGGGGSSSSSGGGGGLPALPAPTMQSVLGGPKPVAPTMQQTGVPLTYDQQLNPATDPMLASIGGSAPSAPTLRFTPTQQQADKAYGMYQSQVNAYNQAVADFNKKNAKKIKKGKVSAYAPIELQEQQALDPNGYDITQYNPYDPYGLTQQMMMNSPAALGVSQIKQSKYSPANPFAVGTPENANWMQFYGPKK